MDLDNDGYVDMLTGQYYPGLISWWRGSENGFHPKVFIEQEGYVEGAWLQAPEPWNPESMNYWVFSSANFADFDGDGLLDLFTGGFSEFRVALNEGTKSNPKFGLRKYLLGLDGQPLSVIKPNPEEMDQARKNESYINYAGVTKSFVNPVDWDGDGVLDILITHLYGDKGTNPVEFFRGVQTDKGLRFEDVKPLFTAKDSKKAFPGCAPNIEVADYNNDGVLDLIFGLAIPTVNGYQIDSMVAWNYNHDLGIQQPGKDAGRTVKWVKGGLEGIKKQIEEDPRRTGYYLGNLKDFKYLTLRHRGYIYVMLGKKNSVKAVAKKMIAQEEIKRKIFNQAVKTGGGKSPVQFEVKAPEKIRSFQEYKVEINLNFREGWHGYANTEGNIAMGLIPTKVEYKFPDGFELVGEAVVPNPHEGTYEVYKGDGVRFFQKFKVNSSGNNEEMKSGEYTIEVIIYYQTCNEERCLPPTKEKVEMKVNFKRMGE